MFFKPCLDYLHLIEYKRYINICQIATRKSGKKKISGWIGFFLDSLNPRVICIDTDEGTFKAKNLRLLSMAVCISEILPGETRPRTTMLPLRALIPRVKSICEIHSPVSIPLIFILHSPPVNDTSRHVVYLNLTFLVNFKFSWLVIYWGGGLIPLCMVLSLSWWFCVL